MSATGKAAGVGRSIPDYPGRDAMAEFLAPLIGPASKRLAGTHVQRLLGYWLMWRLVGGRDALIEQGMISQATAYKTEKEFRQAFGFTVAELDPERVFPEFVRDD